MQVIGSWQGLNGSLLAPRELEGVLHCANGRTVKEAAKAMGCSPETLKKRLQAARDKLKAPSIRALVLESFRRGLISPALLVLCTIIVGHAIESSSDEFTRIRRGGERKVAETRIHRRAECALAVA